MPEAVIHIVINRYKTKILDENNGRGRIYNR